MRWTLLAAAFFLASCAADDANENANNRKLWDSKRTQRYSFTYETTGYAVHVPQRITVGGTAIASSVNPDGGAGDAPGGTTIEDLFDEVKNEPSGTKVIARYDTTLGFPFSATFDNGSESSGFRVSDVELNAP